MKRFFTKQEWTFILITYLVSWVIWLPLVLNAQFNMNIPVLPCQFFLASFGPLIGSVITQLIYYKKDGLQKWIKRVFSLSFDKKWLLLALALPLLYFVIGYIVQYIWAGQALPINKFGLTSKLVGYNVIQVLLIWIFTYGVGEEMGWRGYLFPAISKKHSPLIASYLVTLVWAFWHLPAFFFNPTYMEMGFGVIGWLISLSFGSVLLGYLCEKSKYSIIPVLIWHAGFDLITAADISSSYLAPVASALVIIQGIYIAKYIYGNQKFTKN